VQGSETDPAVAVVAAFDTDQKERNWDVSSFGDVVVRARSAAFVVVAGRRGPCTVAVGTSFASGPVLVLKKSRKITKHIPFTMESEINTLGTSLRHSTTMATGVRPFWLHLWRGH
jgi:hypothetical protein